MFKYLLLAVALWVPAAWSQTPANCAPQDVSLGGTINGQLTSASCNLDTLFNWSPAFAQVYRFAITQRGTVTLEMTASFDSRLYLLDARGNFRASSHRTNGLAVRVFEALEPGTYQVVAAAADRSTGPFRLASWFRNAQICPVTQISLDTSQSGTLDADSCRAGDLMFGTSNEDFAAQFRFSVSQRGTISIDASSDLYEARVYLLDSRYNFRTSSRTVSYSTTRTFEALDPGTYIIVVTARDGASGAFSLKGIFRNPQICPKAPIGLSASAGGLFSPSSCRVGDLMFGNSNEGFAVQYTLTLAKRGTLTVDAASEEVRPGIYLTDARYNFIASSRVVASGQAHTFESLDPGSYVVIVFAQPEETGAYTVKTDFRNPEICPSENLANNSIDGDALTGSSCKVGDLLFGSWNENYAKQYRIHLSQRMPLVVGMHSEDFDSVLYLMDSKFNFLTSDDNSGQGFDARITETLDAGDYVVIAFARDGATGGYTLTTGDAGTPPDPNGTVFLLLHGLNSDPGTWDRFVEDVMGGDCPILTDDIIQSDGAPVSRCYRYAFGTSNSEGFEWQHGDGLTYTELGANVGSAVEYIRRIANPLNLILVGHSRGGLAARAYLQTLTPPLPIRFGLLTIGTPHQGSPFGRIGVWLKDHDYTPDNQDFGHDQLYFMYSPSTRYLATASDSSGEPVRNSVSQPIWDLNDGVGNLNGVVSVYGQITSGGLELGTYPGLGNVLFASALLPGSRDQMLDFVLQNLSTDWCDNGDGIVPSASQRFVNIPGFELTADLWYLDLNNHVFHTQETDYSFDILRILNRMRSSLPPAPPSDAAADKAPPRASAGQHDDQRQSVFPLEQAYLRGEAHLLINAAKDPGYDSGEYTAAVLRLLAAEHEQPARRALFQALALNGSSGATEAIFRLAAFSADARALALEALAAIDRGGAVDALLNHAQNDPDPGLRVAAIHTLGRLHTGGASEALLRLALAATGEQDPAVEALADLPSLKSVNAVKKAVAEFPFRSESVRQRLRTMVEQRERDSTPLLEGVGR